MRVECWRTGNKWLTNIGVAVCACAKKTEHKGFLSVCTDRTYGKKVASLTQWGILVAEKLANVADKSIRCFIKILVK